METVRGFIFFGSKITADGDCSYEIKRHLLLGRKAMTNLDSISKSRDITLLTKVWSSQSYDFSSIHVWIWELDHKESWVPKNWCFWTVVLEKTLESPLDCKEIKPVNPKRNQSWIFIRRTDAEMEAPILWPPEVLSSYFNGLKTRQPWQTQLLPIQENFDLRECQSPVNWELVNMKYLVVLFLLLYCRHV